MGSVEGIAGEGSGHCSIGRDEGHIRSEAETVKERGSVGGAAAGCDGDGDAGALRGSESLGVAGADGLAEGRQQGAVHVDRHQANGGMHGTSLAGGL